MSNDEDPITRPLARESQTNWSYSPGAWWNANVLKINDRQIVDKMRPAGGGIMASAGDQNWFQDLAPDFSRKLRDQVYFSSTRRPC